jgi:chitin deacetylase
VVSSGVAKAPVTRVTRRSQAGPGAKLIALTFDDGPWPGQTRAVLKILVANNVRATFFEIGSQARARPNLSLAVTRAGMLIGNHTETHNLRPRSLTTAQVAAEISVAEKNITAASGQRPRFFRPPGGIVVPAMFPVLKKLGLRWLEWSIDTDDWQRPPAKTIVARVMRHARPGAVVLMHDGGGDRSHTIAALPVIIAKLKAKGYVFVTLDALRKLPHVMG